MKAKPSAKLVGLVLGGLVLGIAAFTLAVRTGKTFHPSVQLPPGQTLAEILSETNDAQAAGWYTNIYCQLGVNFGVRAKVQLVLMETYGRIQEWRGTTLCQPPRVPIIDSLTPRLGECYQNSKEVYLLAKELSDRNTLGGFISLCFIWGGGTNRLHRAREWNALIEQGICNGVFEREFSFAQTKAHGPTTPNSATTNRCVIVRDQPGIAKIIPTHLLKAYKEAGLVNPAQPGGG